MELTFTLINGLKWKTGKFIIDNLKIAEEITMDDCKLYLDGNLYDGTIETWIGTKLSADDIFEQVLNAYLRNDTGDYESFSDDWKVFSKLEAMKEEQDGLLIKFPTLYFNEIKVYELELATPVNRYYSYLDDYLMVDNDGSIVTDIENFYFSALVEDLCKIIKKELRCVYKAESIDRFIQESGGEENFLREYDD